MLPRYFGSRLAAGLGQWGNACAVGQFPRVCGHCVAGTECGWAFDRVHGAQVFELLICKAKAWERIVCLRIIRFTNIKLRDCLQRVPRESYLKVVGTRAEFGLATSDAIML
jgi:hypothetical protein